MNIRHSRGLLAAIFFSFFTLSGAFAQSGPLNVCCSTPDLGAIAAAVGGDDVRVTTFTKGPEDPHFVEAKPGFVKALATADYFVVTGLELEIGWAPRLQQSARNERIQVGGPGYVEASSVIRPMNAPAGTVDRSMGDIHAGGNPHFMSDPINGLKVAALLRDKFASARPAQKDAFVSRYAAFRERLGIALVGETLAKKYDFEKLALLAEEGKLTAFLEKFKEREALSGWIGSLAGDYGAKVVSDHDLWPYFAHRFGLTVVGFLEPKPGVPPTTKHLAALIDRMKKDDIRAILSVAYFDPKHAVFVAEHTKARIAEMAHQVGGRPGADDYLAFVDRNVQAVVRALHGK